MRQKPKGNLILLGCPRFGPIRTCEPTSSFSSAKEDPTGAQKPLAAPAQTQRAIGRQMVSHAWSAGVMSPFSTFCVSSTASFCRSCGPSGSSATLSPASKGSCEPQRPAQTAASRARRAKAAAQMAQDSTLSRASFSRYGISCQLRAKRHISNSALKFRVPRSSWGRRPSTAAQHAAKPRAFCLSSPETRRSRASLACGPHSSQAAAAISSSSAFRAFFSSSGAVDRRQAGIGQSASPFPGEAKTLKPAKQVPCSKACQAQWAWGPLQRTSQAPPDTLLSGLAAKELCTTAQSKKDLCRLR